MQFKPHNPLTQAAYLAAKTCYSRARYHTPEIIQETNTLMGRTVGKARILKMLRHLEDEGYLLGGIMNNAQGFPRLAYKLTAKIFPEPNKPKPEKA